MSWRFVFVVLCLINVSVVSSLETTKACAEFGIAPMQGFVKERVSISVNCEPDLAYQFINISINKLKKNYLGDWFIHQLYDEPHEQSDFPGTIEYDCSVIMRSPLPDGNHNFHELMLKPGVPEYRAIGVSTFTHPREGRYIFTSEDIPEYNGEYFILDTDYESYTIECKCTDVSGGSIVEFYVLSRSHTVTSLTQSNIDKVIDDHQFDRNKIRKMNITSCLSELKGRNGLL